MCPNKATVLLGLSQKGTPNYALRNRQPWSLTPRRWLLYAWKCNDNDNSNALFRVAMPKAWLEGIASIDRLAALAVWVNFSD